MADTLTSPDQFASISPPSRKEERFSSKVEMFNHNAEADNFKIGREHKEIANSDATYFLFCKLCDGKLVKKKNIKEELIGVTIEIPSYSCSICKSKYKGFLPHVTHISKPDIEAQVVTYSA